MFQAGDFVKTANGDIYQAFLFNNQWIGTCIDADNWIDLNFDPEYKDYWPVRIYRPTYGHLFNIKSFSEDEDEVYGYDIYALKYPVEDGMVFRTTDGDYYYVEGVYIPLYNNIPYNNEPFCAYRGFGTIANFIKSTNLSAYVVERQWVKV